MTFHVAIEKLLRETGHPMTTHNIADELNRNKWYQKKDGSKITDFQIHGRTRNYPQLFNRNRTTVSLARHKAAKPKKVQSKKTVANKTNITQATNLSKDEHYVLDLDGY